MLLWEVLCYSDLDPPTFAASGLSLSCGMFSLTVVINFARHLTALSTWKLQSFSPRKFTSIILLISLSPLFFPFFLRRVLLIRMLWILSNFRMFSIFYLIVFLLHLLWNFLWYIFSTALFSNYYIQSLISSILANPPKGLNYNFLSPSPPPT